MTRVAKLVPCSVSCCPASSRPLMIVRPCYSSFSSSRMDDAFCFETDNEEARTTRASVMRAARVECPRPLFFLPVWRVVRASPLFIPSFECHAPECDSVRRIMAMGQLGVRRLRGWRPIGRWW